MEAPGSAGMLLGSGVAIFVLLSGFHMALKQMLATNAEFIKLKPPQQALVLNSFTALIAAALVPIPALLAIQDTPLPSESVGESVAVSTYTVVGTGMSIGYLVTPIHPMCCVLRSGSHRSGTPSS